MPRTFDINGYRNQSKGTKAPTFVPGNKAILDSLKETAPRTARLARSVSTNVAKDRVFKAIFAGLEQRTISMRDLHELLTAFVEDPAKAGVPDDVIVLDSGYWIPRKEIVREGTCRCERLTCVGSNEKVFCYFQASLPTWVVKTGLFWRCYDEIVNCHRCAGLHKRGHIGRTEVCGTPYRDQFAQNDNVSRKKDRAN